MIWLWLAACGGPTEEPPTPGTTEDTGVPAPEVLSASCALSASNPLRVECDATLAEAGAVTLTLTAAGAPTRAFTDDEPLLVHDLLGWGLKAETTYDWQIGDIGGQVTTGPLDPELASGASIVVTGDPGDLGFDAILQPLDCDRMWMVMIDHDGDIVWYEPEEAYVARRDGYEWAPEEQSVLTIGRGLLIETHVSGAERMRLVHQVDYDADLHHDITRWGDTTYVLFEEKVGDLNVDGFYTFRGGVQTGRFFLGDHYTVVNTGMGDWSHANGLNAATDGQVVMSLHTFSSVLSVDGDPASPTFLDIVWTADGGAGNGPPDPTYVPAAGSREGFEGQHNAQLHDGKLWLFDNTGFDNKSRGARYLLDDTSGEYSLDAEWELEGGCPIQGGTLPVDGGVVISCTSVPIVVAFEEAGTESVWSMEATCTATTDTLIRGIPIQIE